MSRWAVVLAGGVGSRFWPLSTPQRPKQLLPLVGDRPLLVEAVDRLARLAPPERTLILTNASLVEPIARALPQIPRENIVAEPSPRGTAAALTWAANLIAQRGGPADVMVSVHADWAIGDARGFVDALAAAADVAEREHGLVTVGVVPARPDPGFGYIEPGTAKGGGVWAVERFVEKPDRERAATMVASGFLWNSGIFVWRVGDFLDEVRALTPEVRDALAAHPRDLAGFFAAVTTPIAVDVGVLERSKRVLVMRGDFGWDDVGTWGSLGRVRAHDAMGNATSGDVYAVDARNSVVHAEGSRVVLYGVHDLVVVVRDGLVLVTTPDKSSDLKTLIEALPPAVRDIP